MVEIEFIEPGGRAAPSLSPRGAVANTNRVSPYTVCVSGSLAGQPSARRSQDGRLGAWSHAHRRADPGAPHRVGEAPRNQLTPGDPAVLEPREARYRPINVILSGLGATMASNPDSVVHGAQVAGSRVTLGAQALRLSFGFVPRSASGRSGSAGRRPRRSPRRTARSGRQGRRVLADHLLRWLQVDREEPRRPRRQRLD